MCPTIAYRSLLPWRLAYVHVFIMASKVSRNDRLRLVAQVSEGPLGVHLAVGRLRRGARAYWTSGSHVKLFHGDILIALPAHQPWIRDSGMRPSQARFLHGHFVCSQPRGGGCPPEG
jgi:uncharacterized membrane protein YgdD (TMEM256/DUF423 family)